MRMKYFVYYSESTAIFFNPNFSLKREEPFCILWCSTQLFLKPHKNLKNETLHGFL